MSSSRGGGSGVTCSARSRSSSVVSPMAETTTTTSLPALRVSTMRWATRLMPVGVGDGRAAVLLHDNAHSLVLGVGGVGSLGRAAGHAALRCDRGRVYRGARPVGVRASHRPTATALGVLALEVGVEPVVGDDRQQRVERRAGEVAPRGDVGELPPPQRLLDVAGAVVAQAVLEVGGDAGQVVGELALDQLGDVGVEDEAVGVDAVEHPGQPQPQLVEVGLGADVGLVLRARREVALGAQPGAGQQHLADLEQQQRDRPRRRRPRGRSPAGRAGSSPPGRRSAARTPRSRRRAARLVRSCSVIG